MGKKRRDDTRTTRKNMSKTLWRNEFKFSVCRSGCYLVRPKKRPFDDIFSAVGLLGTNKKLVKRVSLRRRHWTLMVCARRVTHSFAHHRRTIIICLNLSRWFYMLKCSSLLVLLLLLFIGHLLGSQSFSCSWLLSADTRIRLVDFPFTSLKIFGVLKFVICHFFVLPFCMAYIWCEKSFMMGS